MTLEEAKEKVKDILGTSRSLISFISFHDIPEEFLEDLEDYLLDCGIELCRGCEWWHESTDLIDDENEENTGLCYECRERS